jgi:hypothetical protein
MFHIHNLNGEWQEVVVTNGNLKLRTVKKILKCRFSQGGKWSIINFMDEMEFDGFSY